MARKATKISDDAAAPGAEPPESPPPAEGDDPVAPAPPARTESAWSDYLMTLFADRELVKGKPISEGLRRVVELVEGTIVGRDAELVASSDYGVVVKVAIRLVPNAGGPERTFTGLAEVNKENVGDDKFLPYMVAMCVTRCESIIFRKILGLHKVYGADEGPAEGSPEKPPVVVDNIVNPDAIRIEQVIGIKKVCRTLKIDVAKFIAEANRIVAAKGRSPIAGLEQATYTQGLSLLEYLQKYSSLKNPIPPEILEETDA